MEVEGLGGWATWGPVYPLKVQGLRHSRKMSACGDTERSEVDPSLRGPQYPQEGYWILGPTKAVGLERREAV